MYNVNIRRIKQVLLTERIHLNCRPHIFEDKKTANSASQYTDLNRALSLSKCNSFPTNVMSFNPVDKARASNGKSQLSNGMQRQLAAPNLTQIGQDAGIWTMRALINSGPSANCGCP
jgi:hypothetical protein